MKKNPPSYRYQLRVLAGKVEKDVLTEEERRGLTKFLRELAKGLTTEQILNIKTPSHRPQGMQLEQRIFDVTVLHLPKKHGGSGLTKQAAIAEVAKLNNKSLETIIDEYKSDRGRKIRELVKSNYYNPLADDDSPSTP